ncbi:family 2A encapsulin nanocompartment cargo protein cysteine desulfurase [Nitrosovibrio sp. Nv17]|uniref:family 2A encapsulin nanocompartment cargo protein cysteine desulfurase n=1 Tax=Nitrosovibrio sp. Nv17 TaxID=1855339 RepID=UPI000908DE4F|nr:family 2A encapsulin nanocompartment cargo protein cysteine desulfurase [Nitrosovibrio sp. Nv17]SFW37157.1 cysteine desulfurase / selenocysteine lyase [Nitrosovibrio sp. Nv17]
MSTSDEARPGGSVDAAPGYLPDVGELTRMVNAAYGAPPNTESAYGDISGISPVERARSAEARPEEFRRASFLPGGITDASHPESAHSGLPYRAPPSAADAGYPGAAASARPEVRGPHTPPAFRIPVLGMDIPYADTFAAFSLPSSRELDNFTAFPAQGGAAGLNAVPFAGPGVPSPGLVERSSFYFLDEAAAFGGGARVDDRLPIASAHPAFDIHAVRRDFPILEEQVNGRPLIWLDNAATTQKPQPVIDRLAYFYQHENSNIHRAAHELAARATDAYEAARETVRRFINAPSADEIIFLRGTTEAINLVAQSWGRQNVREGDEIVITWLEHHANIVPWQQLCSETGAKLRVAPVDDDGQILLDEYQKLLGARTRLVSFSQVSNALGTITPARQMIEMARRVGARVLVDGAQSVSHMRVDVQQLDCDWFVFSGHKVFGPTGIGALFGRAELLNASPPWQGGGNMIQDVTFEKTVYHGAPARFEAGTGNIADAVGLGAALEYVERLGLDNISRYEHDLLAYATRGLNGIPGLRLIGTAPDKAGVLSFVLKGYTTAEVGDALNREGIAVRTGHHCAQPILRRFGQENTVRPSLALYNTHADVDALVATLHRLQSGRYNY